MPVAAKNEEPAWLLIARKDLAAGVKETPGKKGTPRIIEMYDNAGLSHDNDDIQSWCGCATGTWLKEAGLPVPKNFYGAKQFEAYGQKIDPAKWQPGDIGVFYRTPLRERDWKRHVGLIVGETATHYELLGGNQSTGKGKPDGVTITKIAKKDLSALRRPVAATEKDLRKAGSREIAQADAMVKTAVGAQGISLAATAVKEAALAPTDIDLKAVTEQMGLYQKFAEGADALAKLVAANPWLVASLVAGLAIWLLARQLKAARVARLAADGVVGAG